MNSVGKSQGAHEARRRCIGCGVSAPKGELFRVVRTSSGEVCGDSRGRRPGRGAYVCSTACFERARAQRRFSRALRCAVSDEELHAIAEAVASWDVSEIRE